MTDEEYRDDAQEPEQNSDPAELVRAWKELLSSEEAANCIDKVMGRLAVLMGKTPKTMNTENAWNLAFLLMAFTGVGVFAYLDLVPDGTTGVLAGIIIGYFFKRDD